MTRGPKTGTLYTLKTMIGKLDLVVFTKEKNSVNLWHKCFGSHECEGFKNPSW